MKLHFPSKITATTLKNIDKLQYAIMQIVNSEWNLDDGYGCRLKIYIWVIQSQTDT